MAITGERNDPLIAFCFDITVDRNAIGGFSECSGIQWETETQDHMEGGRNDYVLKFPTRNKQSNLTLKRGIVDRALWNWYWEVMQGRVRLRTVGLRATTIHGGMTQAEARETLRRFIGARAARGDRTVLVITGKGVKTDNDYIAAMTERGILRTMLPIWLSEPGLSHLSSGWSVAARGHGGEGAWYVRLRRQ